MEIPDGMKMDLEFAKKLQAIFEEHGATLNYYDYDRPHGYIQLGNIRLYFESNPTCSWDRNMECEYMKKTSIKFSGHEVHNSELD